MGNARHAESLPLAKHQFATGNQEMRAGSRGGRRLDMPTAPSSPWSMSGKVDTDFR